MREIAPVGGPRLHVPLLTDLGLIQRMPCQVCTTEGRSPENLGDHQAGHGISSISATGLYSDLSIARHVYQSYPGDHQAWG